MKGVGAHEEHEVGVLDVFGRVAALVAEEPSIDPEVTRLLLRERAVDEAALHRFGDLASVRAPEVVALAATAVERERAPAVRLANRA